MCRPHRERWYPHPWQRPDRVGRLHRSDHYEKEGPMSVQTPAGSGERMTSAYDYDAQRGDGWVTFAGVMLMIVGILNFIGGIAAIDNANFYVANAKYVFSDLNTWGWVILITGGVQVVSGLGIFVRNQFARWLGVTFASLNLMAQF